MGSGSSAARRSREQQGAGGHAPRSRRPSPGSSSSSSICSSSSSSDPCHPSRADVWQQGDPSPAATLPFADSVRSPTQEEQEDEEEEEEDDTDGELEKALAESQDVCAPQSRQEPGSGSPPRRAGSPAPGSSPLLIPSLELQGTPASHAHGWTLRDRALRETERAGWAQDTRSAHCGGAQSTLATRGTQEHRKTLCNYFCDQISPEEVEDLFRGCTQDVENNNMPNKFQSKSDVILDSRGPILYDMSEEELMASIEREY